MDRKTDMTQKYNLEAVDNSDRKYRYEIDSLVRNYFMERIAPNLNSEDSCLEIGSHDGSMTSQLLEYFSHVHLLEPADMFHESLGAKFGEKITLHPFTISEASFEEKFDNIFLIHVLEHLENPVIQLRHIADWLTENGKLFILVPNAYALSRQIACKMGMMGEVTDVLPGEAQQGHLRTYSLETLESDVKSSGLEISQTGGVLKKTLANFQFDLALEHSIISMEYISALDKLSATDPSDSSSIFVVARRR
jgi:2-polyprenyl-3-methyl-5-hydroxy-6-metoxy-1,4-benzoquinol methylase